MRLCLRGRPEVGAPVAGRTPPTINFRVDYLRLAINTALIVTASVRRTGGSVGVVSIDIATKSAYWRRSDAPATRRRETG